MLWIIMSSEAYEISNKIYPYNKDFIFDYHFADYVSSIGLEIIKNSPKSTNNYNAWELYNLIISKQIYDCQNNINSLELDYAKYTKRYIDLYYHTKIKIYDICKILNVSHTFLYRMFELKYKISIKKYLSNVRITQAINLLNSTILNVSQIGELVGFDDVLAFSAFFKKNTGKSPKEYKINRIKECEHTKSIKHN